MTNRLLNHLRRLGPRISAIRKLAFFIAFASFPLLSRAANLTLQGNFTADDNVQFFSVSIAAPAAVDIRSYGYAGGTTSTGAVVPRGGFDTILTLFNASGVFIDDNDDGAGAAVDPQTGMPSDARITSNLAAGSYIVALTQYDNFSIGNLGYGFAETGHPNFTADPSFTAGGACAGNMFRDISGTDGRCRTGGWTVDFLNVDSAAATSVPEPSVFVLAGFGLTLLFLGRNRKRALKTVSSALILGSFGLSVKAQVLSGPDYSTTKDFTNGQRSMLNISDMQIAAYNLSLGDVYILPITTSNSQQTNGTSQQLIMHADEGQLRAFSARMFNQPQAVMLTAIHNSQIFPGAGRLAIMVQNGPGLTTPSPIFFGAGDDPNVLSGVAADFTGDAYDEVAMSLDDGRLIVISANDVNNLTGGYRLPGTTVDKLYAMTAGDFNGDGKREIAGLTTTASGGAQLDIYSVDSGSLALSLAASLPLTTPGASTGDPVRTWSITRGRFNSTNHDQLAVAFANSSGPGYVEVIDFDPGTLNAHEHGTFSPAGDTPISSGFIQIAAAQFQVPTQVTDQIAYLSASPSGGGRFLEVLSVDPNTLAIGGNTVVPYDQYPCSFGMTVGNFDNKNSTGEHDPNAQLAFIYGSCDPGGGIALNIYDFDPSNLNPTNVSINNLPDLHQSGNNGVNIALVSTDLQGRSYILGDPSEITIHSSVQPTVVMGIPPMHMDFIPSDVSAVTPPVPFSVSAVPDGFYSQYDLVTSSGSGSTSTNGTSWSFGAKESVSTGFSLGDPDVTGLSVNDTFTAAQNLKGAADATHGHYSSQMVDLTVPSGVDDTVNYSNSTLHIWAYPVIGQSVCPASTPPSTCTQKVPLTIQFSAVDGDAVVANKQGYLLQWYQPVWEPFNIFSYPANITQLQAAYPNLSILSIPQTFATDGTTVTESIKWNVTGKEQSSTSLKQNYSFENDFSASLKETVPAVESDSTSFNIDLSGSFGFNSLTKNTTDLGVSTGVTLFKTGTFPTPQTYAYSINPYILGTTQPGGYVDNIPLTTDVNTFTQVTVAYTVSIDTDNQPWWTRAYGTTSDVALNHPSRWQVSNPGVDNNGEPSNCLLTGKQTPQVDCLTLSPRKATDAWSSVFHQMRGFFISKAEFPGQGPQLQESKVTDKLQLQTRVYNYSLATMPANSTVHAQFFFAPYDSQASAIVDAGTQFIDEYVSDGPIPAFNSQSDTPNWILAGVTFDPSQFDYTKAGGVSVAFWVLTWVEDANGNLVQEINGHGLSSKPPSKPNHVSTFEAAAALEQCQADGCYSNNLGIYHLPYFIDANGLGALPPPPPPPGPGSFNLEKVELSSREAVLGQDVGLSTTLLVGGMELPGVVVTFYDGDPKHKGRAFATESIPHVPQGSAPLIRTTYRANQCGLHQLFVVVNEGKLTEVERRAPPLRVACSGGK